MRDPDHSNDELAQSEAKYRCLVEATDTGYLILDEEGRVVDANAEYVRLSGHFALADILGRKVTEWTAPHDMQRNAEEVAKCLATGRVRQLEVDYVGPDGRTTPVEINAVVIATRQGSRIISLCRDISERRRAEQALRASEERFRVIFEEAPLAMAMGDTRGAIVRVNHALCRLSGFAPGELVGRRAEEVSHPEDREVGAPLMARLLAGEIPSYTVEKRYVGKGGRVFWGRATAASVRGPDGKVAFILGIIDDVTERRLAREALEQSNQQLRTIYDGIVEGLLITNIATKQFVRVNASLCRMFGYSEEELLAASLKDIHPPEEVPSDFERFQAAAEGRVSINEERPCLRKDGTLFYADITGHPILYEGEPCLLALFRDVTERRQAEEALRKEHENLKHLLQASDHERQLIAYEIHDGLAQQLAGAIMQFQVFEHLRNTEPGQAEDALAPAVTMLRRSHFETRRLIAGVRPPILDESGVVEAIAHLVHEQGHSAEAKIKFHSEVDFDRLAPALENAIYRIAQEGLTNACRHSQSKNVWVGLLQRDGEVRIEVRDWGVGFDPKAVPKDRFGLEGIRQRARLLGGRSSIRSSPGKGARIVVELPAVGRE